MLDLNYVTGSAGQITTSTLATIQTATITTSGFPVQITVTGDGEPGGAGWHRLQIYRDSTPIGQILHIETAGSGLNLTIAMVAMDTPVSGTYTYSVKVVDSSGVSIRYTELGQLSMIVEEKVISSHNAINWIRRDISAPNVYYGYNIDANAADSDPNWSIKKITTSGSVETVKWNAGSYGSHISKWSNRVATFTTPTGSLGLTTSASNGSLNVSWNLLAGVDIYNVSITESTGSSPSTTIYVGDLGQQIYYNPNGNTSLITKTVYTNSYRYNYARPGYVYGITLTGLNVIGTTVSSISVMA